MRVFTCKGFKGYWPTGTAAVVVARDRDHARAELDRALAHAGLDPSDPEMDRLRELDLKHERGYVLADGDY